MYIEISVCPVAMARGTTSHMCYISVTIIIFFTQNCELQGHRFDILKFVCTRQSTHIQELPATVHVVSECQVHLEG